MALKTHSDYVSRQYEEYKRIFKEERDGLGDKDIHNLEMILYSIMPYSRWWRCGCISSLRKAIKALKKENKQTEKKNTQRPPENYNFEIGM